MMHTTGLNFHTAAILIIATFVGCLCVPTVMADETSQSPYMPKITGQEDFVYVWTLGVEGLGDGFDKLVTIDVRPGSKTYGNVVHTVSVAGRHEAHHGGLTDDRHFFWAGGLDTSQIFIFDIRSDPAKPRLHTVISDFVQSSGGVTGPHTFYAFPGKMMIAGLSNSKDRSGRSALVEYTNDGSYIATHWIPTGENPRGATIDSIADGYGYDVRVLPRKNIMLTSSFTGWGNYMTDFGTMVQDAEAMQRFGQTMVVWNLHSRTPKRVLHVPGGPLEIRFALGPRHNYAFTTTALTSKIWLIYEGDAGNWQAQEVADIGDPSTTPLPVDTSLSSDDAILWVTTFLEGMVRAFDVSDPFHPTQIYQKVIGPQVNMVSQSWDGKRLYFTSSLLSKWDNKGKDNAQFFKAYAWDEEELVEKLTIDFYQEKLGRPHIMRFGAYSLYDRES